MPTAASFLDEKPSAASFLDEPIESTPEERPPRGTTPSDFVEPPPRPQYSLDEPIVGGKPFATVAGRTVESLPASLDVPEAPVPSRVVAPFDIAEFSRTGTPENPYGVATPEERAFTAAQPSEFNRPVIPPELFKTALDIGSATLPRSEMLEGFKQGTAEQLSGMTSQSSAAMLPAFAIPYVGPALAMGMGAKAVGAGAGTVVGGAESGNPREVGQGLSEVAGGAAMVAAPTLHAARPTIPPQFIETVRRVDAEVPGALNRSLEAAVKNVASREKEALQSERATTRNPNELPAGPQTKPEGGSALSQLEKDAPASTAWLDAIARNDPQAQRNAEAQLLGEQNIEGRRAESVLASADIGGTEVRTPSGYGEVARPQASQVGARPSQERGQPGQPPRQSATGQPGAAPEASRTTTGQVGEALRVLREMPNSSEASRSARTLHNLLSKELPAEQKQQIVNQIKEIANALRQQSPEKSLLRQERPEVGLQEVRQPQVEAPLPREPARAQGGEEGQVLLKPVEQFVADLESGKPISTEAAHEFGRTLTTPEEIAQLKQAYTDLSAKARKARQEIPDNATDADIAATMALGQKPQYINEAIDGATGAWEFKMGPKKDTAKFHALREAGQPISEKGGVLSAKEEKAGEVRGEGPLTQPLPEPAGPKAGEEQPTPAVSQAVPEPGIYAAGAKAIADRLREQFKTETGGKAFTGPVEIINAAVEIAAKIIEYGGSAADALAAGLKHIRQHSPADEAAFRSKFDESFKAAAPKQGRATLDDVYKIFEPAPKESKGITARAGEAVESFRTGFSSKFRPLNKLAEDIASKVGGKAGDIAGIFEQLKGSSGKAEADVYRFDKDVSDLVKGGEKDFNAYVFLRRSLDRLNQDAADIARAQAGEDVPNLNRRRVSQYTIPQLEAKLAALSEQIGGEKLAQFTKAAEAFQTHMDQALRLQVESGRMSPEVYDAIKDGNQFYAPFKVMKYIEDTMRPEGSGRRVDTTADYVKAMEGIEDPNFKLGDMLSAARQNLTLSRTLAEKNRAMQNITELAALDVDGNFVQKLKPGQDAPRGMEAVNVMENGVKERYATNEDVAQAVQNAGPGLPAGIVARWSSNLFRAGATTLNLAFQPVNLIAADAPRAALVSKYGVKGVTDLVRYPMDFVESLFSSIAGDVFGVKNKLFQDFLDSGAAGTTVQQYLTPEALRFKPETATSKTAVVAKTILNTIPQFANAIEQTSKVLGVKRAMRLEGAESGAALAKQIPEAITEIRRFSGSPDFGRSGKWTDQYRLNLVYMFLNARIQGAVADVGRLTGRDGASRAGKTWLKVGAAVGIPTAYLYMLNNSDEYKKDYDQRPEQEKQNYWLIPKDTFITGANGEKMRDYWRVPKREIAQWMGNAVESGLDFAKERDPKAFWKWAEGMAESIAPVNIRGDTLQERGESVLSGTHPFIKAPIETATGRDLYRHRAIVPDSQKKASPEQQYTDRTAQVFKSLADAMPDVAPEALRSPLMLENMTKNFTAGLITQFLPGQKPVAGRSAAENLPLTQRFQALPYTDSSEFNQRIQKFERESADEQLKRMRDAKAILESNKGARPDVLIQDMIKKYGRDEKLAERIVDLYVAEQRGITSQERRVLALPVTQRAEYLADELKGKTSEQKAALLRNWALKRILTERVGAELAPRLSPPTPNPNP